MTSLSNDSIKLLNTLKSTVNRLPLPQSFYTQSSTLTSSALVPLKPNPISKPSSKLSSTLTFFQIQEVLALESLAGLRLIKGAQIILGKCEASVLSPLVSDVEIYFLSDCLVVIYPSKISTIDSRSTLYDLGKVSYQASSLILSLPNITFTLLSSPPATFLNTLEKFKILPPSIPKWSPSTLSTCELKDCKTPKFSTLNRRHHCRRSDCGKLICRGCSRWEDVEESLEKMEGASTSEGGRKRRVCKDCFLKVEI